MRHVIIAALAFMPTIALVCSAAYLAAHEINGWGWFLFAAVLVGGSYSYKSGDK